jgi:2-dehydropantoate 2-reductase
MLRDIENGSPIEADHVIGDLLRRGQAVSLLSIVYTHLKAYEARRGRNAGIS